MACLVVARVARQDLAQDGVGKVVVAVLLQEQVTDALNHTTTYQYDGNRRLQDAIDALNNRTTVGYDSNGNVQTVTDALGRLTGAIDALGNRATTSYDVSGLKLTSTDALLAQVSEVYDTFGRGLVVEEEIGRAHV